ncbi:hypothetical protein INT45_000732 [Circinella minor]|uniref:Reverse transcriptase domain-containing protein n=1 Tax=Circinella minor TaxID=1195481 RepID=A0A8H7VGP6_9FUNG|nr:hypothetical protein INT45_000732 [Circinella minor]
MEQAKQQRHHDTIGLILDFEKAYEKVYPIYLSRCLQSLDFQHTSLIAFGDPLPPILFNLALEPFLKSILCDSFFKAFSDDTVNINRLDTHLTTYQKASNAKLNFQKTISISLSDKQQTA